MDDAIKELNAIVQNLKAQGKTDEQVKQVIKIYLMELRKRMNPNGELDIE